MSKTTVHGVAVLSSLELFECAGCATHGFLEGLGADRAALQRGARIEWDAFAALAERAIESAGAERLLALDRPGPFPELEAQPPAPSARHAIDRLIRELAPALWPPLLHGFEDRGEGLALARVEIPEPLALPRGYLEAHALAIARFPRASGLQVPRVLDLWLDRGGRRASVFFELPDELVRAPLGPLGDVIRGIAVVGSLDIAELAGVDLAPWLARHRLDRAQLMADAPVPWDAYRELAELCAQSVGEEALRAAARSFAELTRELRPLAAELPDLLALYRALNNDAVEPFWGPLGPSVVEPIRPGVIVVRMHVRAGLPGCAPLLHAQAGTLEGLTAHRDLPPARLRSLHLDAEGATGTFVLELPQASDAAHEPADGTPSRSGATPALATDRIVGAMFRERSAARARVVERLGVELASCSDVHAIAEVVLEGLLVTLGADGAQVDLTPAEQAEPAPLRARGRRHGEPLVRRLEHGGERVGVLRVWTTPASTGEILAALDVMTPWIAVAFGTALERAHHARVLAEAEAAREGAEQTLDAVLEVHPGSTFVLDGTGEVRALSERAARALASDPQGLLARLAGVVGEPELPGYDVLPVRVGNRIDRIVIIERWSGAASFEERIARAAERWGLTPRQRQALDRIARGMSNKEIAQDLGCAEVTVESHLTAIYRRASVGGRNQLAAKLASM